MMFPKHEGPESQAQELAWLYGSLAAAWSLVAQYQRLEAEREAYDNERMREKVFEAKPYRESPRNYGGDANDPSVHPDEGPATSGGQSC
jgi:hypothetical protein